VNAVLAVATAIVLSVALSAAWRGARQHAGAARRLGATLSLVGLGIVAGWTVAYPAIITALDRGSFFAPHYVDSEKQRRLIEFFRAQPKDSLVASDGNQGVNIAVFAQRPVLYADPYTSTFHVGYMYLIAERQEALREAVGSRDPVVMPAFLARYGIDFFITRAIDDEAGTDSHPADEPPPWMQSKDCIAFKSGSTVVFDAACLIRAAES
jgi:hypothetical protein